MPAPVGEIEVIQVPSQIEVDASLSRRLHIHHCHIPLPLPLPLPLPPSRTLHLPPSRTLHLQSLAHRHISVDYPAVTFEVEAAPDLDYSNNLKGWGRMDCKSGFVIIQRVLEVGETRVR